LAFRYSQRFGSRNPSLVLLPLEPVPIAPFSTHPKQGPDSVHSVHSVRSVQTRANRGKKPDGKGFCSALEPSVLSLASFGAAMGLFSDFVIQAIRLSFVDVILSRVGFNVKDELGQDELGRTGTKATGQSNLEKSRKEQLAIN
jgi:hypothetical protein